MAKTGKYDAWGKRIVCPHCGGDDFAKSEAQLNTAAMTFFHLDWANKSATTLACTQCSRIQWFMEEPVQQS
jgi:predicted nucleic-acid-binding Zn-ribbon protein